MGIEIKGGDEFQALLKKMLDQYPDVLDMSLDDTADAISL